MLTSHEIAKSQRIRDFLTYVCERAMDCPDVEIHERELGCQVFGRPADFDPHDDNIVRVTASNARKKLQQYFALDGISEQIILEIPKGKYTPVFREREIADAEDIGLSKSRLQVKLRQLRRLNFIFAACAVLLGLFAVWSSLAVRRERSVRRYVLEYNPALNALWSQLLVASSHTDVIVTDSSLSLFQELLPRQITLADYLHPNQWMSATNLSGNSELKAFAQLAAQRGFTSMGSVTTAYHIAQLALGDQGRISILRPRDFDMTQMKSDNVVLLGSSRANPWEEVIEGQLQFRFGYDQRSKYSYFEDLKPNRGGQTYYRTDSHRSYCRIAFIPNLTGTGNVLSIAGTEIEGTEGCGDFVTRESSVEELLVLAGARHGSAMPYFEALLGSSRVGGQTGHLSIVAFHVIKPEMSALRPDILTH